MSELNVTLSSFTDVLAEDPIDCQVSQPLSLSPNLNTLVISSQNYDYDNGATLVRNVGENSKHTRPSKGTGQVKEFRSVDEIDSKYRCMFSYPYFNLVQSRVIEDALYSDKSMVVCAPTGSGKTVVFEMAIVQLLMEFEDKGYNGDYKIVYMAPVKSLCTERLTEWYPKLTQLGLLCIEVTGDTDVDFSQLKPYRVIITTPEKWDILTRRWTDYRGLVEVIKLFLIDEVHILNDETRGPVLEAVVSRMKAIESSSQSAYRIERLQKQYKEGGASSPKVDEPPKIRFVAVSATVSNPEDVAAWLGKDDRTAVFHKYGEESRPVKLQRVVEGYPCPDGTSIFKFDIILNYKLWPIIQKYYNGKPTLIFCNTRKSVFLTAEALAREVTVTFSPEQKAKLTTLASTLKNKKLQMLVLSGVGCHHAGLLFEERTNIEQAFRKRDLPILITTTTLAMGVNLPAHLVIIKNTQQYVNGAYQEYSISTVLQMVGRAGRPQFDTEATAVIMTRMQDKARYQSLVGGSEPLQSYLHKRLAENLNSEAALHTVTDVAQCVQWLRSTFLYVRAAKDPKRYLGLPNNAPQHLILKKIEELCVKAMNGLASSGLITMDDASCIEATEAGRLMSVFYLDFDTMKKIMKIEGTENLEQLLWIVCESHELSDMHLRVDERRCLNALNRNNSAATIRFPMKGKVTTRQMKLNCLIQSILGCLPISDPSLTQEAMKIIRIAERVCKCMVAYVTRADILSKHPKHYSAVLNAVLLEKCILAHLWENSPYLSKQLKGIGPTFSTLLATAGKVTFMQIEESHPRDLERIMNKGPPAGNVLHKQVTLLPKYQLTMTPIDEKSVSIQLMLLNQNFLLENMDSLTAGVNHKCYIVVGDSENFLLHFTSFKDKDLLQMYDGIITLIVHRIHRFEHKMFVHCISCNFVGIDDNCEYLFKDLDHTILPSNNTPRLAIEPTPKKVATKQTTIKDTYKERKRRSNEAEISQSKEKKRRESSVMNKFIALKKSFGNASKEVKNDVERSLNNSTLPLDINRADPDTESVNNKIEIVEELYDENDFSVSFSQIHKNSDFTSEIQEVILSDTNEEDIDDCQINSILREIESEINHNRGDDVLPDIILDNTRNPTRYSTGIKVTNSNYFQNSEHEKTNLMSSKIMRQHIGLPKTINKNTNRFPKPGFTKRVDNYKFIELLENNTDLSDEEEQQNATKGSSGFSETIQNEIQKFLSNAKTKLPAENYIDKALLRSQSDCNKDSYTNDHDINNIEPEITWEKTNTNHLYANIRDDKNRIIPESSAERDRVANSHVTGVTKVIKSLSLEENDNTDFVVIPCSNEFAETVIFKEFQKDSAPDTDIEQLSNNLLELPAKVNHQQSEIVTDNTIFEVDDNSDTSIHIQDIIKKEQHYSVHNGNHNSTKMCVTNNPRASQLKLAGINDRKCVVGYENSNAQELTLFKSNITFNDIRKKNYTETRMDLPINNGPCYDLNKLSNIPDIVDPINMSRSKRFSPIMECPDNNIMSVPTSKEEMQRAKLEIKKELLANPRNTFDDYDKSKYANFDHSNSLKSRQNFSFKAKKVDIWNKNYDNKKCSIKVVQNIKINVDITKSINDNARFSKENCKPPLHNNMQNNQDNKTSDNMINQDNFSNVTCDNANEPQSKLKRYPAEQLKPVRVTDKIVLGRKAKMTSNDTFLNGSRCIVANNVTRNDKTQEPKTAFNTIQNKCQDIALRANQYDANIEKPERNEATETESSKPRTISDVLQKYANIFKQKSCPSYKDDIIQSSSETNEVKTASQQKKTKKLFKINDIQHIDIDLTKILDNDACINYPIVPVIIGKDEENINGKKETKSYGITDVVKVSREEISYMTSQEKVPYKEQFTVVEDNSESPPQSEILNGGTDNDYDVNQSMLNPQILLQCLGEDKIVSSPDLIPPPPEFCDSMAYSPSPHNEDLPNMDDSYFDEDDNVYEKDLTAPETWSFSREKDEMYTLPYSNEFSESVGPVSYSDPFSPFASRKTKLDTFKLKPKSKLRKY